MINTRCGWLLNRRYTVAPLHEVSITSCNPEAVVEGSWLGIICSDALARAAYGPVKATGTLPTTPSGIHRVNKRHFLVHPSVSGWRVGLNWSRASASTSSLPFHGPSATTSNGAGRRIDQHLRVRTSTTQIIDVAVRRSQMSLNTD